MPKPARRPGLMTVEEYLRFEEASPGRHEYVAGRVYAMSGARLRHGRIVRNVVLRLYAAAAGGPCEIFFENIKVRVGDEAVYYPDVFAVCGPREPDDAVYVEDVCLLVEVISPGTERTDRREKLLAYKRLPALRAYLIVDQAFRRVQRHWRDDAGAWHFAEYVGSDAVPLPCPATRLPLDVIYEGIAVPERPVRRVRERAPAGVSVTVGGA